MAIIACKQTALFLYSRFDQTPVRCSDSPTTNTISAVEVLTRCGLDDERGNRPSAHLLMLQSRSRHKTDRINLHAWERELPGESLCKIGPDIYATSPEFTFFHMAKDADVAQLAFLGTYLCGTYRIAANEPAGFIANCEPLTNASKLVSYAQNMKSCWGIDKARRAVPYAMEGSASPAETKLALLTALPRRYGGFGIPCPHLNFSIGLTSQTVDMTNRRYLICDMYWPEQRVAVEYDSDLFHTASERIYLDAEKRNVLEYMGIRVLTITKRQLYNVQSFSVFAKQLCKHLGIRFRPPRFQLSAQEMDDWFAF